MNECLGDLKPKICIPYHDDVLCYGRAFDQHLLNVKFVFQNLNEILMQSKDLKKHLKTGDL